MRPEEVINKMKETRDQSETGHSKRTEFGHGPGHEEVVLPIVGPSKRKIGVEPLDPPPVKQPSDSPGPVRHLSASEVDLIGLVGSTEVPALLIPADSSRPVTKTEFDLDKLWKYDAVGYDKNRLFLTEENAYLDHLTNPRATDWVEHHSDAAKDPLGELRKSDGKHSIRTRSLAYPNGAELGPDLVGTQLLTGNKFRNSIVGRGARDVTGPV
jgi:hypothetical protein